jgi:hypothetical protein
MSLKKLLLENKVAVLVGVGAAAALSLIVYLKNRGEEDGEEDVEHQASKFIDPSVKNVSLFDRLGGDFSVDALVARFVDRITADKRIKHHFQGSNVKVPS